MGVEDILIEKVMINICLAFTCIILALVYLTKYIHVYMDMHKMYHLPRILMSNVKFKQELNGKLFMNMHKNVNYLYIL